MHGDKPENGPVAMFAVQRMHPIIEEFDMQQPVHTVKMKRDPDENQRQSQHKPDGVILKGDHLNMTIGHGPEHQHFKKGPDQHTTDQRVKHIVPELIVKHKAAASGHKGRDIFQLCTLLFAGNHPASIIELYLPAARARKYDRA